MGAQRSAYLFDLKIMRCFLIICLLPYVIAIFTVSDKIGYLETVIKQCCDIGRERSAGMFTCEGNFQKDLDKIHVEESSVCLSAINLCCTQTIKDRYCEEGKQKAKAGGACNLTLNTEDKYMSKYCCESCKLGLIYGSFTKMCDLSSLNFGHPWDKVFDSCCSELQMKPKLLGIPLQAMNICDLFPGKLCSHICVIKNGTYECRCKEGFYLATDGKTCLKQIENPCGTLNRCEQICTNRGGIAECSCKDGFKLSFDNETCVDVNECQLNIHNCDMQQRCDNTIGSYQCIRYTGCGTGYTLNSQTGECEDDDECALGVNNCHLLGPNYECKNTLGSFRCTRKRRCYNNECSQKPPTVISSTVGYIEPRQSPGFCVEKNECAENSQLCEHECVDTLCSYKCKCRQGYTLHKDNRSCIDIDECELFKNYKPCVGLCVNKPGSYKCDCPEGYKLGADNISCQDIDECLNGDTCKNGAICQNIRGSYRCNKITCPVNYVIDFEYKNRCKRSPAFCRIITSECMKMPLMYTFSYISFVSNIKVANSSRILINIRGLNLPSSTSKFFFNFVDVQAPPDVPKATKEHFQLTETTYNTVALSMVKPIIGPQDIELNVIMDFTSNNNYIGFSVSNIFIYVSKYEF